MRLSVFHDSPELEMSDDFVNTHFAIKSATSVHCSNSNSDLIRSEGESDTEAQNKSHWQ